MSQNPAVLALHFLLEVAALVSVAVWGWTQHEGLERWAWTVGLPVLLATVWAVFRAAEDGPEAIVPVPGAVRLALELVILGGAALLLWRAAYPMAALGLAVLVTLDYALSYDRVLRLLGLE